LGTAVCCLHRRHRMEHLWNVMRKGLLAGKTLSGDESHREGGPE
jgi:hypothetical protein